MKVRREGRVCETTATDRCIEVGRLCLFGDLCNFSPVPSERTSTWSVINMVRCMPCLSVAASLAVVDSSQVGAIRLVWRPFVLRDEIKTYAD